MTHQDIQALPKLGQKSDDHEICPSCNVSWLGASIPNDQREKYYGGKTHYSKLIGVEIPELYDGVILWRCPNCKSEFRRF